MEHIQGKAVHFGGEARRSVLATNLALGFGAHVWKVIWFDRVPVWKLFAFALSMLGGCS
jgi:hypothetical protein